jgi:hypothetical protein
MDCACATLSCATHPKCQRFLHRLALPKSLQAEPAKGRAAPKRRSILAAGAERQGLLRAAESCHSFAFGHRALPHPLAHLCNPIPERPADVAEPFMFALLDAMSSVLAAVAALFGGRNAEMRPPAPGENVSATTGDIHHVRFATVVGKNALKDLTTKGNPLIPPLMTARHKFLRLGATFPRANRP